MNFTNFQSAVAKQFTLMAQHPLYRTNIDKDTLWDTYLSSFPEGSNPIYRVRTEHDCSCCRQFIRNVGDVVAIIDGRIRTIWDRVPADREYAVVAAEMATLVRSQPIGDVFLHYERSVGTEKSLEDTLEGVKTWNHFHVNLPAAVVAPAASIPTKLGDFRTASQTFERALREIKPEAVDTVLELIAQGSLYRGNEHKHTLVEFHKALKTFNQMPDGDKVAHVWHTSRSISGAITGIRNTSIGTLLRDLSDGKDLEYAVKAFEAMVAPANYKRPTALVTPAMVEKAKATVQELGLTTALERRYATLDDITINNVLFADRSVRKALGADPFDLPVAATNPKAFHNVEEVPIAKFLADVLPKAASLELLLENKHAGNLVSLVAPVDPTAARLFKWNNAFSWSYTGDVADSMKERVKAAGGKIEGDLCCRLAWDYKDDLDLHFRGPNVAIYFARRQAAGGHLDVDANGMNGMMDEPVENIVFSSKAALPMGTYSLEVNNFNRRSDGKGFEVEVEADGTTYSFAYDKALSERKTVIVAFITKHRDGALTVAPELPASTAVLSRQMWGLPSQQFHRVTAVMLSPNYWDGQGVGNKHYFFTLDGCRNDGKARGFYNEFLRSDLDPHRKVLEMVGAKMKTDAGGDQLSGLGFSETQRNAVFFKVTGAFTRVIKVVF